MESLPLFSDASFEKLQDSDETEESIVIDDPRDHQEQQNRDEAEKLSYTGSAIGDIAIFRDFFLAAFSDGYYNVRTLSIVGSVIYKLAHMKQCHSDVEMDVKSSTVFLILLTFFLYLARMLWIR